MCGIAGFIESRNNCLEMSNINMMIDALIHRGPDSFGVWDDKSLGVAIGHRRLSILDLSPAGHQPMVSRCGRYVLAFNGEIYNHLLLRDELEQGFSDRTWLGHSDTETLLEAFSHWGIESTLQKAKGMFAIALWDRARQVLTLSRDRLGEKPLYYGFQKGVFLFGSELKALRAHPAFQNEIDRESLVLYLRHYCVPGSRSIYKNIFKICPGSYLQVSLNSATFDELKQAKFWSFSDVAELGSTTPYIGSENQAVDRLEELISQAVCGQMQSDVPLGAMLSGGVDSSLVAALMQANSVKPIKTFTIGFEELEYDESHHARVIAKHLGCDHTELRLTGADVQSIVPELPKIYDEPFADSSQLPTYLVMKLARQHVKVALSGDGGDELFGGYVGRYVHGTNNWKLLSQVPFGLRKLAGFGLNVLPVERFSRIGNRLINVRNLDEWFINLSIQGQDIQHFVIGSYEASSMITERRLWPHIDDPIARVMALDAMTYLPDDILVKVDRSAMAVSLETRAPFLDKDVVEFACSLPMKLKIRDDMGKWILRQVLYRHVPRKLVERPKMGFSIPLDDWLRGPLCEWAEELLDEGRLKREGFFCASLVRKAWHRFLNDKSRSGSQLWAILMFQAWLESQQLRVGNL